MQEIDPEVVTGAVLIKNMFLNVSQYSQENICVGVTFSQILYNSLKHLRTPTMKSTSKRLLLL